VIYWEASAVVPLLAEEPASAAAFTLLASDREMVTWWGTEAESVSAVTRRERERDLEPRAAALALSRLDALAASWSEVVPSPEIRATARRLLRVHRLRAGEALQLAAAVAVAEGRPASLRIATRDLRLGEAAAREGFPVIEL
jgi:predicted nucleic acid-binding protein